MPLTDRTPASLLERLRGSADPATWDRLVDLYAPLVHAWGRRAGLQDADAADLVQDTFLLLHDKLPEFRYDPRRSFRNWLRTLALNCWRARERKRRPELPGRAEQAQDDPAPDFWERDSRQYLVARALVVMQREFEPNTWRACWLVTVEGRTPAEAATELLMTVGAVHAARCRVLARLQIELAGLTE